MTGVKFVKFKAAGFSQTKPPEIHTSDIFMKNYVKRKK